MDKDEIANMIQRVLKECDSFYESKTYDKAMLLDQEISILRFLIGEENFLPMHYFHKAHEEAVKLIDEAKNQSRVP